MFNTGNPWARESGIILTNSPFNVMQYQFLHGTSHIITCTNLHNLHNRNCPSTLRRCQQTQWKMISPFGDLPCDFKNFDSCKCTSEWLEDKEIFCAGADVHDEGQGLQLFCFLSAHQQNRLVSAHLVSSYKRNNIIKTDSAHPYISTSASSFQQISKDTGLLLPLHQWLLLGWILFALQSLTGW